jgi:hypothetical protein
MSKKKVAARKAGNVKTSRYSKTVSHARERDITSKVDKLAAEEVIVRDDKYSGPAPLLTNNEYFYPFLDGDEIEDDAQSNYSESDLVSEISDAFSYGDNGYFSSDDDTYAKVEQPNMQMTKKRDVMTTCILPNPQKLYSLLQEEEYVNE